MLIFSDVNTVGLPPLCPLFLAESSPALQYSPPTRRQSERTIHHHAHGQPVVGAKKSALPDPVVGPKIVGVSGRIDHPGRPDRRSTAPGGRTWPSLSPV